MYKRQLLTIGDDNIIREGVTIHRGTIQDKGETLIGNRNLIMAYSHIAHDCVLGDDIVLTNQAALAGSVKVGDGAILGGYAIVHQFCSIGSYSFCAMGTSVNKDVPAYVKVRGNPAKPFGINTSNKAKSGKNYIVKANKKLIKLDHVSQIKVNKGDKLFIKTPGGGGFG